MGAGFVLGSLCTVLFNRMRFNRKKRISTANMVDEQGAFLVTVGYMGHTNIPIKITVYREAVVDGLHKEISKLRRRFAEAEKGHEATFAAIRQLLEEKP